MIDLHNHILPGIDDGAGDLDESLEIARQFVSEGVARVVATPHRDPERQSGIDGPAVRDAVAALQRALDDAGIDLEVLPGQEIYLTPDLPELLEGGSAIPLAGTRAVLVEVSLLAGQAPLFLEESIFRLQLAGYRPVLAHPERYPFVQRNVAALEPIVARGIVLQLTAPALLGDYGPKVRGTAQELLRLGWYALAGSDRHHPGPRRSLADLRDRLGEVGRTELADLLLRDNPERLLAGRGLLEAEPVSIERTGLFARLFHR